MRTLKQVATHDFIASFQKMQHGRQLWHVMGGCLSRLGQTGAESCKVPPPPPAAVRWHCVTLSHQLYECTLSHLCKESGVQLKDGKQTCFYFESITAQDKAQTRTVVSLDTQGQSNRLLLLKNKMAQVSIVHGNYYNEFRMHSSSFTVASAPVSKRNSHHMLFLVAQCNLIFCEQQLQEKTFYIKSHQTKF